MTSKQILSLLPYQDPFLFVDSLYDISSDGISGNYTFKPSSYYYKGHFKDNPVTPGVILTETMAQIGVVSLGIYLLKERINDSLKSKIAMSSYHVDFFLPVYPDTTVKVISEKDFFRFKKLKCKVKMFNEENELICKGVISGMIYNYEQ